MQWPLAFLFLHSLVPTHCSETFDPVGATFPTRVKDYTGPLADNPDLALSEIGRTRTVAWVQGHSNPPCPWRLVSLPGRCGSSKQTACDRARVGVDAGKGNSSSTSWPGRAGCPRRAHFQD